MMIDYKLFWKKREKIEESKANIRFITITSNISLYFLILHAFLKFSLNDERWRKDFEQEVARLRTGFRNLKQTDVCNRFKL